MTNNTPSYGPTQYVYADTGLPIVSQSSICEVACAISNHTPYKLEMSWQVFTLDVARAVACKRSMVTEQGLFTSRINFIATPISYGVVEPHTTTM